EAPGRLVFRYGKGLADDRIVGKTQLERWQWYHVTLVRNKEEVTVYLNGKSEIAARVSRTSIIPDMFIGGRSDNQSNWEGRIDEVAVFDRVLTPNEIKQLSQK
ncbi:MAG: LamG domain-containing protein, partial [Pirellulaceae bacterium]